jgi:N-acetylglucosamine kinase-like BadF-type ATPase
MMDQYPPILIGVDGGGTGCRVVVGTAQDGILAEAKGGRANVSTNFDEAIAHILEATRTALNDAGQDAEQMNHAVAHLGLAGFTGPEIGKRVTDALPFGKSVVTEDTTTTMSGPSVPQTGSCWRLAPARSLHGNVGTFRPASAVGVIRCRIRRRALGWVMAC